MAGHAEAGESPTEPQEGDAPARHAGMPEDEGGDEPATPAGGEYQPEGEILPRSKLCSTSRGSVAARGDRATKLASPAPAMVTHSQRFEAT